MAPSTRARSCGRDRRTGATTQHEPQKGNLHRLYALFHAITRAAAEQALPNAPEAEQNSYTRNITHTAVKTICAWIAGNTPPEHVATTVTRLRINSTISDVASAFIALHEARESADYDHEADMTRPTTLGLIRRSAAAVHAVEADAATDDFRALLGLLALQTRIRKG